MILSMHFTHPEWRVYFIHWINRIWRGKKRICLLILSRNDKVLFSFWFWLEVDSSDQKLKRKLDVNWKNCYISLHVHSQSVDLENIRSIKLSLCYCYWKHFYLCWNFNLFLPKQLKLWNLSMCVWHTPCGIVYHQGFRRWFTQDEISSRLKFRTNNGICFRCVTVPIAIIQASFKFKLKWQ